MLVSKILRNLSKGHTSIEDHVNITEYVVVIIPFLTYHYLADVVMVFHVYDHSFSMLFHETLSHVKLFTVQQRNFLFRLYIHYLFIQISVLGVSYQHLS